MILDRSTSDFSIHDYNAICDTLLEPQTMRQR